LSKTARSALRLSATAWWPLLAEFSSKSFEMVRLVATKSRPSTNAVALPDVPCVPAELW
jgi:hypothetical protein